MASHCKVCNARRPNRLLAFLQGWAHEGDALYCPTDWMELSDDPSRNPKNWTNWERIKGAGYSWNPPPGHDDNRGGGEWEDGYRWVGKGSPPDGCHTIEVGTRHAASAPVDYNWRKNWRSHWTR